MTLLEYYPGQALLGLFSDKTAQRTAAELATEELIPDIITRMAWDVAQRMVDKHPDNQ